MSNNKNEIKKLKAERKMRRKEFNRQMNELFSNENRYSLKFEETHVFEDGKAYINVDLTKVDSPFSIYSYDNRINPEIYDYINQETEFLRSDIPVVVNFDDGGKYTEGLKDKISKAVKRHYSLIYEKTRIDLKRSYVFGFVSFLIGALILSIHIFLGAAFQLKNYEFYGEILSIVSWVFIWESVDRFFLSGNEEKIDVYKAGHLALMEIQFGKPCVKKTK